MNSWNLELYEFKNDGMAPSKRHSTLVSLIFILNCISKTSVIKTDIIKLILLILTVCCANYGLPRHEIPVAR